jgi:periplasmic divalent cation tolerance protein
LLPLQYLAPGMGAIAVITTVGTEQEANDLAEELLGRRLAACVNIISSVSSVYRWKGRICKDSEYMLVIKSLETEVEAISATIRELHSYELPEVLAVPIQHGGERFLDWIAECVDKSVVDDDYDDDLESGDRPA